MARAAFGRRFLQPNYYTGDRCTREFPVRKFHSPIANLFRCYFAILITGADAELVADAARPCVVQP